MNVTWILTLIPCIRERALSGRNALNVLIVLKAGTPDAPNIEAPKLMIDT